MSGDALLEAIRAARRAKAKAGQDMQLLLAYAREHVTSRPYRLADLADAAGLSISGVRTGYSRADHRASRASQRSRWPPAHPAGRHEPARPQGASDRSRATITAA